jgi:hypothetical protein
MPGYSWLSLNTALAQLAQRLNDPSFVFWNQAELIFYIQQSLRMFNVLTFQNKTSFVYNSPNLWNSLGLLAGSPRARTLTDVYCYTQMQAMLLEPMSGGTWTGTTQFNISDLSQALQTRRDEMLQVSNANQSLMASIATTPNTRRTFLPDTVIDVARARWIPKSGSPVTLYRDDTVALEFYESPLYQISPGTPQTYQMSSEPPLSFDVDIPPSQPGTYEAIVLQSGTAFDPPTPTLLGIPDDFAWVLIWGALADLLGRESEATDRQRSAYCLKRYQDGLTLLLKTPWIMLGSVNGIACTVDSIFSSDRYMPEWDSTPATFGPAIITGGIDFIAAPTNAGIGLTVLGNMPVPVLGNDFLQVSRSDFDIILDLSQSLASFKMAGSEWEAALELEKRAVQACSAENSRLRSLGAFSDILVQRGQAQERDLNRYNAKGTNG